MPKNSYKPWPKNDEPFDIEKVIKPIYDAIKFAYKMERKNIDKDIPYNGPVNEGSNHVALEALSALSARNLKYSLEEQGRDALEEILVVAIQLGIEQGRRIFKTGSEYQAELIQEFLKGAKLGLPKT